MRRTKLILIILIISFVLTFMFVFFLLNFLGELGILDSKTVMPFSVGISVLIATMISTVSLISIRSEKKTRWKNFWAMNYPNFILLYIVLLLCVISLKTEIILTLDELKETISLGWMIFSISITIFLVWNVVILQLLQNERPNYSKDYSPLQTIIYIQRKGIYHEKVAITFITVHLLTINLFTLLCTSVLVYFSVHAVTLFTQTLVNTTFYLCANTLVSLFLDILRPIKKEKMSMLETSKITETDLKLQNDFSRYLDSTLNALKAIKELPTLSEKEKNELQDQIIKETLSLLTTVEESSDSAKE